MKFCDKCNNMLSPYEENSKLYLHCENCGFKKLFNEKIVYSTVYKKVNNVNSKNSNKYLIHDVTLKRTNKKKCLNTNCPTNTSSKEREIIFFPMKNTMELIFICSTCNAEWKNS